MALTFSANSALWRNADYQWTRLFAHIAIALVVTLTFLQLNTSLKALQYRVFAIFFATILPALVLAQIEPQYIMSRMTFNVGSFLNPLHRADPLRSEKQVPRCTHLLYSLSLS